MDPVEPGLSCGSDTAHLSIFGYDPRIYYEGRGSFETMGAGLDMKVGDIGFKSNFATLENDIVVSRRADRNFENIGPKFCEFLNEKMRDHFEKKYPEHEILFQYATEHRCGIRIRGPNLSNKITNTDPLKDNLPLLLSKPKNDTKEAIFSAELINNISKVITEELTNHEINNERKLQGKSLANVILFRGCGVRIDAENFESKHKLKPFMIAPTAIIKGLGMTFDMTIIKSTGGTGDYHTDLNSKRVALIETFKGNENFDFGFLHVKAVDDAGHDKNLELKIEFLERIDTMIGDILEDLKSIHDGNFLFVLTGDHSTPVLLGDHSYEPVPFAIWDLKDKNKKDKVEFFSEIDAAKDYFVMDTSETTTSENILKHLLVIAGYAQFYLSVIFFILFLGFVVNESILLKNDEKFTFPGNFISLKVNENISKQQKNFTVPDYDDDINDSDYKIADQDDDYDLEKFQRKNDDYVHVWCEGNINSNITIVLESDLYSNYQEWISFMNFSFYQNEASSENYRVCCYDRVGLGFSFSKSNTSMNEMIDNLNHWLSNAGVTQKKLFIGRGFGGFLLLNYLKKFIEYKKDHIGLIFIESENQIMLDQVRTKMNAWLSYFGWFRIQEYFEYFKKSIGYEEYEPNVDFLDYHVTKNEQIRHNEMNSMNYWKSMSNEIEVYKDMKKNIKIISKDLMDLKISFLSHQSSSEFSEIQKLFNNSEIKMFPNKLNDIELYKEIKNFIK